MSNSIQIVGALQDDPELRFTSSGKALTTITVRDTEKAREGVPRKSHFFDITCWGDLAEHVASSLEKGDRVIVSGKLEQQKWEDKETGKQRSKIAVVAFNVAAELSYSDVSVVRSEAEATAEAETVSAGF